LAARAAILRCRPRLVVAAWRARVVIFFIVCSRGRWRWRSPVAIHRWTVRWVTARAFAAADVFGLRGARGEATKAASSCQVSPVPLAPVGSASPLPDRARKNSSRLRVLIGVHLQGLVSELKSALVDERDVLPGVRAHSAS